MIDHNEAMSQHERSEREFMGRMESNHAKLTEFSQTVGSFTQDYQRLYSTYTSYRDMLRQVIAERDTLRAEVERLRKTDAEILACNYPDGEENGPTVAAPDFDLICFARQLGIRDTARKATQ